MPLITDPRIAATMRAAIFSDGTRPALDGAVPIAWEAVLAVPFEGSMTAAGAAPTHELVQHDPERDSEVVVPPILVLHKSRRAPPDRHGRATRDKGAAPRSPLGGRLLQVGEPS
jgi:hypothetical protein